MQVCGVQLTSSTSLRREPWPLFGGSSESTRDSCCFSGSQKLLCKVQCSQVSHSSSTRDVAHLQKEDKNSCVDRSTSYLHVQTLRSFPVEKICGEVVLVRLDSVILLDSLGSCNLSLKRTLSTIKYLYKAGAKVLLVTSWDPVLQSVTPVLKSTESLAGLIALGWTPVDIGPSTLERISSLMPSYKKILWIGPTSYDATEEVSVGAIQLGQILDKASHNSCDVILVGSAACKAVKGISVSSSQYTTFENGSIVWEFLKGRILPSIAALDKSYPYKISWDDIFSDPEQPLFVDIGSGNGLFLFQMARNWEGSNFLGLEMNEKLVIRCLQEVASAGKRNLYFLSTNATSTFRSIISSYPGQLTLVTIQCPNPDFNKEQNRWKMVRRMLVEAVADLLQINGKIYLQSDVETVLLGMKEQFISHVKGLLVVDGDDDGNDRMENPFGVMSDWERHVLARGAPMYRTMLRKV